jgi:hypothetical protein
MVQDPIARLTQPCASLTSPEFVKSCGLSADKFGTANTKISGEIFAVLKSNMSVDALLTHVTVQPEVPAVAAVEDILAHFVGEAAFTDDMKQYTGWRVRQIIEFLGGQWVRAGVRIRGSRYKTGSIYSLSIATTPTS